MPADFLEAVEGLIKASFDVIDAFNAGQKVGHLAGLVDPIIKLHQALVSLDGARMPPSPAHLARDIAQQLLDALRGGHTMTEAVCRWAEDVLRRDAVRQLTEETQQVGMYIPISLPACPRCGSDPGDHASWCER